MDDPFDLFIGLSILIVTFLVGAIILALFFPIIFPYSTWYQTTIGGEHTGIVTAIDYTGIIYKTYDVYFKTDSESTQEDIYCVVDKEVLAKLREYQHNKTKITIIYDDYILIGYGLCGASPIITKINEAGR